MWKWLSNKLKESSPEDGTINISADSLAFNSLTGRILVYVGIQYLTKEQAEKYCNLMVERLKQAFPNTSIISIPTTDRKISVQFINETGY